MRKEVARMKSPFPGMDPYIEACGWWAEFHGHLIEAIYHALARALPRKYKITTGLRSYVVLMESEGKKDHLAEPDLTITEPVSKMKPRQMKGSAAVATPPQGGQAVTMRAFLAEEMKERFVEIYAE